jgi:hypothetical protein
MSADTAVDFSRSSCTWLLAEPPSHGQFRIDAVLKVGGKEPDQFVLASQVFAGNVYADGPLFKEPPYGFAIAVGASRYRIFRDAVRGEPLQDTEGTTVEGFKNLQTNIAREAYRPIDEESLMSRSLTDTGPMSVRVGTLEHAGLPPMEMEFPVRHINVNPHSRRFQVETGPILTLAEGYGHNTSLLRRAFVIFGSLDRMELLVDLHRPSAPGHAFAHKRVISCDVSLMELGGGWTTTKNG